MTSGGCQLCDNRSGDQNIMCEIMERINEETRIETREETLKEVNELNMRLINENRLDDLRRAATDIAYQSQLLRELFPQKAH